MKGSGINSEKQVFSTRKSEPKRLGRKLCNHCYNKSSTTRHSKSRNVSTSQDKDVDTYNYDSAESSHCEYSSCGAAHQSCLKYSANNRIESNETENRKKSGSVNENCYFNDSSSSNINCKLPLKNVNGILCSDDIVMTRSMRKRKIGWLKHGRTTKMSINETELSDNLPHRIECNLRHDAEDINFVEEARRVTKSPKLEIPEFYHFGSVEVDAFNESTYDFPSKSIDKDYIYSNRQNELEGIDRSHSEIRTISFEEWQKEASNKWATYTTSECDCSTWQQGTSMSNTNENSQKIGTGCSQDRYNTSYMSYNTKKTSALSSTKKETRDKFTYNHPDPTTNFPTPSTETEWTEPKNVRYREISGWPHLNDCIQTLELLNIGGTNVLGEFIPFILLYAPHLKSLGQWINTMIYGNIIYLSNLLCDALYSIAREIGYLAIPI